MLHWMLNLKKKKFFILFKKQTKQLRFCKWFHIFTIISIWLAKNPQDSKIEVLWGGQMGCQQVVKWMLI